ncbi:MAG: putative Ig domain-containing protein, partial [Anaerolineaceae bacterium]
MTQNIPTGQFVDISSGDEHVCAIDNHRQLHCWGNLTAALALVPTDPVLEVSAGVSHDCAIKKIDNRPVCWGSSTSAPNSTVQKLAVGNTHACAIKLDGTLTCWGTPAMTGPAGNTYTAIDSGSNYSCAQKSDGKISCWGSGSTNLGMDVNTSYDRFSSGFAHTCALRPAATTTLSCWGDSAYGKAPVINISPTSLAQYLVEARPFSQSFEPAGGFAPYILSVSGGSLPPGLTLSGSTLAGTPITPGSYSFTLAAAETFPGSSLPLQLTPGFQSYSTTVLDGTTTASLVIPAAADAGAPVIATTTVTKIPTLPALT